MRRVELPSSRIECWLLSDGRGPSIVEVVFEDVDPDELRGAIGSEPQAPDGPYNCLLVRAGISITSEDSSRRGNPPFPEPDT